MSNKTHIVLGALFLLFVGCYDNGLTSVSGVEGSLHIEGGWPDSIYGITVLALDSDITSDPEHPADYLVSYGNPVVRGDTLLNYFIQLDRGAYYLASVGITVEPSFFITKLDSFLANPDSLPLSFFELDAIGNVLLHPVIIKKKEITTFSYWSSIQFDNR